MLLFFSRELKNPQLDAAGSTLLSESVVADWVFIRIIFMLESWEI